MKYVLYEFLTNLLNVHWWIWIAVCMFVAVKTANDEEDEQIGKHGIGFVIGGLGVYLFERYVGSARSFGFADILTIALMTWLLGMIIRGRKSKPQAAQSTLTAPTLSGRDDDAYILCRQCLVKKYRTLFDSPSSGICIECQQESGQKRSANTPNQPPSSIREQLRELKSLLEDGLISEADYDRKKSELLDKM